MQHHHFEVSFCILFCEFSHLCTLMGSDYMLKRTGYMNIKIGFFS